MKRDPRSIVTALLLVVTATVFGWAILLVTVGVDILEMFHIAAPSSAEYTNMLRDVCVDSQILLCLAVVPMSVMTLLWLFAFLGERRKHNSLKRHIRQQSA